jgi:hypothetical protein
MSEEEKGSDWMMGRDIRQQQKSTTIIDCIVPSVMHKFLPEYTQGKKSGDAVAWTSAAPMRLHCLICYAGIMTLLFFACS